jgi:sporulation protein YlmC with PRC-barrel domain
MLHNIKELYGNKLAARDGDIGRVQDFYFDDKTWVIRYLVADTGSWLTGRRVLISPHAFGNMDQEEKTLHVKLHKKQIEDSPSIESHKPVSRQYEMEYYRYYGWPAYWEGGAMWGFGGYPVVLPPSREEVVADQPRHHHRDDKHLQSTHAVAGYQIETADGTVGHVSSFLIDEKSWAIREMVVEAGHWYAGKEILISTSKVERISYEESKVFVNLTKADIERTAENDLVKAGSKNQGAEHCCD